MKKVIKFLLAAVALAVCSVGVTDDAHAWLKIRNSTNKTLNVAYAYSSVSSAVCGYFDYCSGAGTEDYRVKYWFVLAQGAEATVQGEDFNNAINEIWARSSDNQLVWQGGGQTFRIKFPKGGNHCGWVDGPLVDPVLTVPFLRLNGSRCCGVLDCAGSSFPSDKFIQLVL